MKQISLRLDDELLDAINDARGQKPREAWIRDTLAAVVATPPQLRPRVRAPRSEGLERPIGAGLRYGVPALSLCNTCLQAGPPKSGRECPSCGARA